MHQEETNKKYKEPDKNVETSKKSHKVSTPKSPEEKSPKIEDDNSQLILTLSHSKKTSRKKKITRK